MTSLKFRVADFEPLMTAVQARLVRPTVIKTSKKSKSNNKAKRNTITC